MKAERKTVYVAGPLTPRGEGNHSLEYLYNVKVMIRAGIELLHLGFAPFIPALDLLMFICLKDDELITDWQIKDYSMAWLKRCDAVLMLDGWESSSGAWAEINEAKALSIPVFYSIHKLCKYFRWEVG